MHRLTPLANTEQLWIDNFNRKGMGQCLNDHRVISIETYNIKGRACKIFNAGAEFVGKSKLRAAIGFFNVVRKTYTDNYLRFYTGFMKKFQTIERRFEGVYYDSSSHTQCDQL